MAEHDDRGVQLMLAFQRGDNAAFDQIVEEFQGPVFHMLRRLLGPHALLEDLAQEAFVRLYRARERYQPRGKLTTFLYRITYNLALNRSRDDKRNKLSALPVDDQGRDVGLQNPDSLTPDVPLDQGNWARLVANALAELPENQRSALVFQHYDGLDLTEIGEILGISPKAVKSLLHRARTHLRDSLQPYRDAEQ